MKTPNVKCLFCSLDLYMPKNRVASFKYCSRRCLALGSRVINKRNCLICDAEFEHISSRANKAKYCSRKCYHRSQINRGNKEFSCHHCQKTFLDSPSRYRKYCSKECVNKSERANWHPKYSTVRKKMFKEGLIEKCKRCSYDAVKEILGVHHIDRNRNNNVLTNLEILCPNCHSLEHMKHIAQGFKE